MKPMTLARTLTTAWFLIGPALAGAAPPLAPTTPGPETAAAPQASLWSRLWRTPDQRGQALLQQGNAAGAAQTFSDPQHKGYAALQAHDYAAAAKALTGIDTAPAHYNQGNALAHTGDLAGAIAAYDAALKQNPQHTDARHNRDVVAAALKKQQDDKKDNSQKDPQQNDKSKDKSSDKKDDSSGDKPNEKPQGQPDGKEGKPDNKPGSKPGDGKDDKPGDTSGKKDTNPPGESPAEPPKPTEPPKSAPQAGGKPAPDPTAPSPKDEAAQAQRDAEAALGKGPPPPASASKKAGAADAVKPPLTEKQIAQEQWLRAIPDDPGGLLRRKFLIEHMLRQQGQKP